MIYRWYINALVPGWSQNFTVFTVSKLLLNVEIMGKRKKNAIDSTTKLKVKNFETATRQVHLKSGDERVENSESWLRSIETSAYASQRKAYVQPKRNSFVWVISSPLWPRDGSVRKVIKSELASVLEKRINASAFPALTDDLIVHIVDGMAFIQVHKSTGSSTFAGELTSTYFTMIAA